MCFGPGLQRCIFNLHQKIPRCYNYLSWYGVYFHQLWVNGGSVEGGYGLTVDLFFICYSIEDLWSLRFYCQWFLCQGLSWVKRYSIFSCFLVHQHYDITQVVDGPEIQEKLHESPTVKGYLDAFYKCDYSGFFKFLGAVIIFLYCSIYFNFYYFQRILMRC